MAKTPRPTHREIVERITIKGKLVLLTPAQFGSGDAAPDLDMPLLEDELDGSPLLTGSSIAGALRSYLTERELGYLPFPVGEYNSKKDHLSAKGAVSLFGGERENPDGLQSSLIVHDALASASAKRELRDGVKIDAKTRTAQDRAKYDMEMLAAGTTFDLCFEMLISNLEPASRTDLIGALVTALHGLETGEITLGKRKRRGFGECQVREWVVYDYHLGSAIGLINWLAENHPDWLDAPTPPERYTSIRQAFGGQVALIPERRKRLLITATFALDSSLLVRSGFSEAGISGDEDGKKIFHPDVVQLESQRLGKNGSVESQPVLPGTSLGGVLRGRARRILLTLQPGAGKKCNSVIDNLFGPENIEKDDKFVSASRIETKESVIMGGRSAVQNRIRIDRFTGGTYEGALFSEEALFGAGTGQVELSVVVRSPSDAEIGLMLLILKDLWSGDLRVGGGASIGRGRLLGLNAEIHLGDKEWRFQQKVLNSAQPIFPENPQIHLSLSEEQRASLETYVEALKKEMSA